MLWVMQEAVHIDGEKRYRLGESEPYETRFDSIGELYESSVREFGRCTGKVYIDGPKGNIIHVGWTFIKRMPYEDDPSQTYLHETWVTVHDGPPKRTIEYAYHEVS